MSNKVRVPITVEVIIDKTGAMIPRRVIMEYDSYRVDKYLGKKPHCPYCIPVNGSTDQYSVVIAGYRKNLYYEPRTNKWFSVLNEES